MSCVCVFVCGESCGRLVGWGVRHFVERLRELIKRKGAGLRSLVSFVELEPTINVSYVVNAIREEELSKKSYKIK